MHKQKWSYIFSLIYVIVFSIAAILALISKNIENAILFNVFLISWFVGDIWIQQNCKNEEIMSKLDELEKKLDEDILLKNKIKVNTYLDVDKLKDMLDNKQPNDFTWVNVSFDNDKSKNKIEDAEDTKLDEDNKNKIDKSESEFESDEDNKNKIEIDK